jgi:putative ABC transport system ATP-binding protein
VTGRDVLVRCVAVARTYGSGTNAVVALHGATATVRRGDRIAVSGPSGSGKSTLLHLMAGLDVPTAGDVARPDPAVGAAPAGVVFQGPSLVSDLDVRENVALPLLFAGVPAPEAMRRAHSALATLDIGALGAKLPAELSSGQAQRVAVARVLASGPALILADEPTGRLDRANADHVVTVLLETADALDAGLVLATHDEAVAARMARRWQMLDGRLTTDHGAVTARATVDGTPR